MKRFLSTLILKLGLVGMVAPLSVGAAAPGQVSAKRAHRQAEVTGNNVYVRSGPSLNHYPVGKLAVGDRVTIVNENSDWYEIFPLKDTFCFISGDYVDTADGKTGVVNGDNVRVRAGSTVPEFAKLKYVVLTKLSKGAPVTVLKRDPDGFLRIKPPAGITVWISRRFVKVIPDSVVRLEKDLTNPVRVNKQDDQSTGDGQGSSAESPDKVSGTKEVSTFNGYPMTEQRKRLKELDAAARAELKKTIRQRRFDRLIASYQAMADQDKDEFAKSYATARLHQLEKMQALIHAVTKVRRLSEQAESKRRKFLEDRAQIRADLPPIPTGVEVQGELRISALYPPGSRPRRYRLIDPTAPSKRTIGYVELKPGSTINVDDFLGRFVGVRASAVRLQKGGVDPIPIYVARELIRLQAPAGGSKPSPQHKEGSS